MTMEQREREEVSVVPDVGYERRRRVVEYAPSTSQVVLARVNQFLWLLAGIIVILLITRFALVLISADTSAPFARFIFGVTNVLVAPFVGVVASPVFLGGTIDMPSVFGIVAYLVLVWIISEVLRIVFAGRRGIKRVSTYERHV